MTDELPPCKCGAPANYQHLAIGITRSMKWVVRCGRCGRQTTPHQLGERAAEEWRRMQEQSDE